MPTTSDFSVTLSDELLDHLKMQARRLHVPVKWLVASLVYDTFSSGSERKPTEGKRRTPRCRMA
jgi:hypothetical protein